MLQGTISIYGRGGGAEPEHLCQTCQPKAILSPYQSKGYGLLSLPLKLQPLPTFGTVTWFIRVMKPSGFSHLLQD